MSGKPTILIRGGVVERRRNYVPNDERDRLTLHIRRVTGRNARAFDEGFAAAVDMVARGATLERLREAQGVVVDEWRDTEPVSVGWVDGPRDLAGGWDDEPTVVD